MNTRAITFLAALLVASLAAGGIAWHKGKLYASYGFNKGSENTPTEEAHVRVSRDGGKT